MSFQPGSGKHARVANEVLAMEVASLNADFSFPHPISVSVERCGEPNAFYDPETVSITFCAEFVPHLRKLFLAGTEH